MIKKYTIQPSENLHAKIYYSVKYGAIHHIYMGIILLYAIFSGVIGTAYHTENYTYTKVIVEGIFFGIVLIELLLKFSLSPQEFIKKPWYWVEVLVLICAFFVPELLVLMAFRFFVYLYTFFDHPIINRITHTFVHAFPTLMMSSSVLAGCLVCFGLLTTALYGDAFSHLFGHIGRSLFTLIQMMTFDDWVGSVVKPVMHVYPFSWIVFFSFTIFIVFGVLNIFVGTVVNAMNFVDDSEEKETSLDQLRKEIVELKGLIQQQNLSKGGKS